MSLRPVFSPAIFRTIALVVATLFLVACGGGSGSDEVTTFGDGGDTDTSGPGPVGGIVLTVVVANGGSVTSSTPGISCPSDCSQGYDSGTSVSLVATPSAGYSFAGWSGACAGVGGCTVSMTTARTVTANFSSTASGSNLLRVAVSGFGYITSPTGISCGSIAAGVNSPSANCLRKFGSGTDVLTATPYNASFKFDGWSGDC
ncbi:MAG: hypothetical protein HY308_14690, partial [Gammaproteobacteria bacterium]|nr:hypothetical protein [Gammaproteobacteria bacterium]